MAARARTPNTTGTAIVQASGPEDVGAGFVTVALNTVGMVSFFCVKYAGSLVSVRAMNWTPATELASANITDVVEVRFREANVVNADAEIDVRDDRISINNTS